MKNRIINKLKSYSFWLSLGGALTLVAQAIARAFGCTFNENIINDIVTSIAGVLVVFGVITTPVSTDSLKVDSMLGEEKSKDDSKDGEQE